MSDTSLTKYGVSFESDKYSGTLSIEFSNVTAAIYIKGFAFNIAN